MLPPIFRVFVFDKYAPTPCGTSYTADSHLGVGKCLFPNTHGHEDNEFYRLVPVLYSQNESIPEDGLGEHRLYFYTCGQRDNLRESVLQITDKQHDGRGSFYH